MKIFLQNHIQLLRRVGLPVFLITCLSGSLEQLISLAVEELMKNPDGLTYKVWLLAFISLFSSLFFQLLILLFSLFAIKPVFEQPQSWLNSLLHFFIQNTSYSLIETLRAWGSAFLYFFLLIIPGFWKMLQYTFVPWIVCYDPRYQKGTLDALNGSKQIFLQKKWSILTIFLIFSIAIPSLFFIFEDYKMLWVTPLAALGIYFLNMIVNLIYFQALSNLFFNFLKEQKYEPTF